MMEPAATDPEHRPKIGPKASPAGSSAAHDPPDGDLVRRVLGGGQNRAFDELIRRYQRQAVAVSFRLLGNTHDALEVTQDAFLKAFSSISSLQKPEAFGGWLMRIVSNLSLNYRRGRKSRSQLPLDDLLGSTESPSGPQQGQNPIGSEWMSKTGDPIHGMQSREMGIKLQEALNQLPDKQRQALVLFTIEEMPQKEVAEQLNCSVEAVKWHVFQGRKKLKEMLKEHL
jgi:RNA polymerase sigma-70 factor (ECF subfamily)